jgi:hypothetical protein
MPTDFQQYNNTLKMLFVVGTVAIGGWGAAGTSIEVKNINILNCFSPVKPNMQL